jgi:MFS family permease
MAGALVACALCSSAWAFTIALGVAYLASGIACSIAQASLVDLDPEHSERRMTHWTLAGEIGDLGAPLIVGLAIGSVHGWRAAWLASAALLLLASLANHRLDVTRRAAPEGDDVELSMWQALRLGLGNRRLLLWSFAVALCSLLDETLAALAALHDMQRFGPSGVTFVLVAFTVGGMAGLIAVERWLAHVAPTRLLIAMCCGCIVAYGGWLASETVVLAVVWAFVAGAFISPQYPLAIAQGYRCLPGRSGLVNAIGELFSPIDFLAPLALGLVADVYGVPTALGLLLLQPAGIMLVTWLSSRRSPR